MSIALQVSRTTRTCTRPLYDFLAPNLTTRSTHTTPHRQEASSPAAQYAAGFGQSSERQPRIPKSGPEAAQKPASKSQPMTQGQRDFLTSALRVNQAGELAATLIYKAQTPLVVSAHPHLRPLMKHMYDQEEGHFTTFNALLAKHRIRPTALYPVWTAAATVLGWGTAVMGREAAMACTEAVETEIGGHYNDQVRVLLEMVEQLEKDGEEVSEEILELTSTIRRIRDEELEHLDHAIENDAQQAVPHSLLTGVIRAGCRGAIWVSERV